MIDGPTGRTRHREKKRFLRSSVLVLQIEEQRTLSYNDDGIRQNTAEVLFWRDARVEDLLTEDHKKR